MEPLWMQILSMNMHSDEILDFQSNIGCHGNAKIISIHSIRNATHIQYRSRVTSDVQMQFSGFLLVDQKHHVKMTTWLFWKNHSRGWQKFGTLGTDNLIYLVYVPSYTVILELIGSMSLNNVNPIKSCFYLYMIFRD